MATDPQPQPARSAGRPRRPGLALVALAGVGTLFVAVRLNRTGLGLPVAPGARLDDGLLEVRVFGGLSKLGLLRQSILWLAGRHAHAPSIRTWQSRRVRIDARKPRPVRADSQDHGTTPVEFRVLPAALRVIAPT